MKQFNVIDKPTQLSKHVEAEIEGAIRAKIFPPGAKLPSENVLASEFDVSRTAIREAIRMLSARGLVEVFKGRGVFVTEISADSVTNPMHLYLQLKYDRNHILDIVHARQIIEPPIAASAAQHHTAEDAALLRANIQELADSSGDYEELAKLDMRFHLNIAKASENPIIPLILEPIQRLLPQIKSLVYASVEDAKDSALVWHQKIADQIFARNSEGAKEAMIKHLTIAEDHARRMLAATKHEREK